MIKRLAPNTKSYWTRRFIGAGGGEVLDEPPLAPALIVASDIDPVAPVPESE